jgi:hypothetical protein
MANIDSIFGFRPVKGQGAGYTAVGSNEYVIANGESSAIYQGDPVVLNANGSISVGSSAGAELIGIFNGCFYDDPTTKKPTFSNFYPGGVAQDNMKAFIFDDPNMLFEVKVDDTNGGQAQVGSNANIATYSAGSSNDGVSNVALDGSSFATQLMLLSLLRSTYTL